MAIIGYAELSDFNHKEIIIQEAKKIDEITQLITSSWLESEEFREILRKQLLQEEVDKKNNLEQSYTVSDEEEIFQEIRFALMDAGRRIDRYIRGKTREAIKAEKKRTLEKYMPEVVKVLVNVAKADKKELDTVIKVS